MSRKQKFPVNKFIVFLCLLILVVFLTVPFLDRETSVTAQGGKRKAVPQIFTSNPLTALVNSIYAMLEKTGVISPRRPAARKGSAPQTQELLTYNNTATESRAAVDRGGASYLPPEASGGNGGSFNARFDYGDASFQNENGDWVLVRQTQPEVSRRGMHEVNANDNAYDRYVNQERAARYTPTRGNRARVPDSKLASLFRPIKNLFSRTNDHRPVQPAALNGASAAPLVASSGIGAGNFNKMPSSYPKAGDMDFTPSGTIAGLEEAYFNQMGNELSSNDLFDEDTQVQNFLNDVDKWFEKDANGKLSKEDQATRDRIEHVVREYAKQRRAELYQQMDLDAQAQKEDAVKIEDTILCKRASSFYGNTSNTSKCDFSAGVAAPQNNALTKIVKASEEKEDRQKRQAAQEAGKKEKERLRKLLPPGTKIKDLEMMVILGKNQEAQAQLAETTEEVQKQFYEYALNTKCKKEDCIWVATGAVQKGGYDFYDSVTASGLKFKGDPAGLYGDLVVNFLETNDKEGTNYAQNYGKLMSTDALPYVPYTVKEFESFQKQPFQSAKKTQALPLIWIHSAKNAAEIKQNLKYPAFALYDTEREVFSAENDLTPVERGHKINDYVIERYEQGTKSFEEKVKKQAAEIFMDSHAKKTRFSVDKNINTQKKNWKKSGTLANSAK